jgi:hypothetical protein
MAMKGELPDSFSKFLKGAKFGKGKGKFGKRRGSTKGRGKIQAEALSKKGEKMEMAEGEVE